MDLAIQIGTDELQKMLEAAAQKGAAMAIKKLLPLINKEQPEGYISASDLAIKWKMNRRTVIRKIKNAGSTIKTHKAGRDIFISSFDEGIILITAS